MQDFPGKILQELTHGSFATDEAPSLPVAPRSGLLSKVGKVVWRSVFLLPASGEHVVVERKLNIHRIW